MPLLLAAGNSLVPAADSLPGAILALVTLTAMEIVLGIDNVVFISLMVEKVNESRQDMARRIGLIGAMCTRIGLLLAINWVTKLTGTLFTVFSIDFSGRDLILMAGGLFLLGKSTFEIHERLETGDDSNNQSRRKHASMITVIAQIIVLDMIFSLDSVITAVGMARDLWVMITAIVLAVSAMLVFSGYIADFIQRHPTFKMLALAFLILIGVMLIAEGLGTEVNKGYVYFAMAFALGVEILNMVRRKHDGAAEAA